MAESVFNRRMFQNINAGPDFVAPLPPSYKKPSETVEDENVTIDFGDTSFQKPLGIMDVLAQTQFEFKPEIAKAAYEEYAGAPKTAEDFASVYDEMYPGIESSDDKMKFEKNLALARLGLNLMKPTAGGALAPAIAAAGENFIADLASINEKKRQMKAANLERETEEQRAKREYVLNALDEQRNTRDAAESELFMKMLEFNLTDEKATAAYRRELAKQFYNYQYDADMMGMENNAKLLMDQFEKEPIVFALAGKGGAPKYVTGYVQMDERGRPMNMIPQLVDGQQTYVPDYTIGENAVKATFQFTDAGVLSVNAKTQLEIAEKINTGNTAIQFIDDIIATIAFGEGAKVGAPGKFKGFAQEVYGTILDVADEFSKQGVISGERYDQAVKNLESSVLSDLANAYTAEVGDRNFATDPVYDNLFGMSIRKNYDPDIVRNQIRVNSIYYALARARKPTGRLNMNAIDNAKDSMTLYDFNVSTDKVKTSLIGIREELMRFIDGQKAAFNSDLVSGDPKLLLNYSSTSFSPTASSGGEVINPYPTNNDDSGFDESMGGTIN